MAAPRGLRPPARGRDERRVHDATAAAPIATGVILEALRRLERFLARVLVLDVAPAPGTERERVRHDPPAVRALGSSLALRIGPLEPATAARAVTPEALQLGVATRAAQLGGPDFALAHRANASSTMRWMNALYLRPALAAASAISCSAAMKGLGFTSRT